MEIEDEVLPTKAQKQPKPATKPDYDAHSNLDKFPLEEADRRQIKDMKFIRLRVKDLVLEHDDLIQKLQQGSFTLQFDIQLPDIYQKCMSEQRVQLSNYEVADYNRYSYNSLSLYNFRIDEATISQFVASAITVSIKDHDVIGTLSMNKLMMSHDFNLKTEVELKTKVQVTRQVKVEGKKKQF